MSYILDALRKAERDRHLARVPTIATVHGLGSGRRSRRVPWLLAAAGVAGVAAIVIGLRAMTSEPPREPARVAVVRPATSDALPAPSIPSAGTPSVLAPRAPEPPLVPRAAPSRPARPAAASTAPTRVASMPTAPPNVSAPPASSQSSTQPIGKPESVKPEAPKSEGTTRVAIMTPDRPTTPAATSALAPSLNELAAPIRESLPKMKLEVLYYSDTAGERLAFINGRKYVEGQAVEGKAVVEHIAPEGVVLSYQGQRFMLRQ